MGVIRGVRLPNARSLPGTGGLGGSNGGLGDGTPKDGLGAGREMLRGMEEIWFIDGYGYGYGYGYGC